MNVLNDSPNNFLIYLLIRIKKLIQRWKSCFKPYYLTYILTQKKSVFTF